jgi:hypothetical protein
VREGFIQVRALRPLALIVVAIVALAACDGTGGGWLIGLNGGARATIGFTGSCVPTSYYGGTFTGSLSYIDRSTSSPRVSFVLTSGDCWVNPEDGSLHVQGTYQARPKGDSGTVELTFVDTGTTGPSKGDSIWVSVNGGAFGGYQHSGTLLGGNITITVDP